MRTAIWWILGVLVLVLACTTSGVWAQTSALPVGDVGGGLHDTALPAVVTDDGHTNALPTDAGVMPTSVEGEEALTPPPTNTPVLPATARRPSLMVRRGEKEVELRLSYSHFSKSTVFIDGVAMIPVIVVGEIGVERTRKDILIASVAARYGIWDNLEGELKIPFRYQTERRAIPEANPPEENLITGGGIGDLEGALYYQLPKKDENAIRWIVNLGVKSATGTDIFSIDTEDELPIGSGFWATKIGISGVKVSDPAALFWNLGYTYNWERDSIRIVKEDATTGDPIVNYVDIKPGDTIDIGGGLAYALNPRLSVNTGVTISFNGSTDSQQSGTGEWKRVSNTSITSATLRFGAVWLPDYWLPVDVAVGMGLTDDSPDFTIEWRQNFKF